MPRQRLWRPFILGASYVFYAAAGLPYVLLLAGSTVLNQAAATVISRSGSERTRRAVLVGAVVADLGTLGLFKYMDFFIGSFNGVFGTSGGFLSLLPPVGVSFFTFQAISYVV